MSVHRTVRAQRGLLLPLLALVLAGGGVLWLGALQGGTRDGVPGGEWAARKPLLEARDALIAYAGAYPESYGPPGAGPGHLVCPDTDTPPERRPSATAARADGSFAGDGPNPPCGGGPLAIGRLPRHVVTDLGRRAFHHAPSQRFVYAVSSGYVNNPSGHAVHRVPEPVSDDLDVVAIVVDPGGVSPSSGALADARDPLELLELVRAAVRSDAGPRAARMLPHAFVIRGELVGAAERRVAAWFVERATRLARRRGAVETGGVPPDDAPVPREGAPSWPGAACGEHDERGTTRWIDDRESACPEIVPTIENTPPERHWFVREGWSRDLEVRRDPGCRDGSLSCRLVVSRTGDGPPGARSGTTPTPASIVIELVPDTDARRRP